MIQYVFADIKNNRIYGMGMSAYDAETDTRRSMRDGQTLMYSRDIREAVEHDACALTHCDRRLREFLERNGKDNLEGYRLVPTGRHYLTILESEY